MSTILIMVLQLDRQTLTVVAYTDIIFTEQISTDKQGGIKNVKLIINVSGILFLNLFFFHSYDG